MTPIRRTALARMSRLRVWLVPLWLALFLSPAQAHKPSDAFLTLDRTASDDQAFDLQLHLALRDLDLALDLDQDRDGRLVSGEVRAAQPAIERLVADGLVVTAGGRRCDPGPIRHALRSHSDGPYAVLRWVARCPSTSGPPAIDYRVFAEIDTGHRLIAEMDGQARLLVPGAGPVSIAAPHVWLDFVTAGVHHILAGADHLAFVVLLLIPVVRRLQNRSARAVAAAIREVTIIVTAFTAAHSLTLALAVTGVATPASRPIESLIALSIVCAALLALRQPQERRAAPWRRVLPEAALAFGFGLVHGFGFATVLGDGGLAYQSIGPALLGFNLGVEMGQLLFVLVMLPLLAAMSAIPRLGGRLLPAMSVLLAVTGGFWFFERAFGWSTPAVGLLFAGG